MFCPAILFAKTLSVKTLSFEAKVAPEPDVQVKEAMAIDNRVKVPRHPRPMHLCAISFKQCWQDDSGRWMSYGGFPLQMEAVGRLFDKMTLMIERGAPRSGGLPLPEFAEVVVIPSPVGTDGRRKISVLLRLPSYLFRFASHIRRADAVHTPLPGDMPLLGMLTALCLRRPLLARYGGSWVATNKTTLMNRVTRGLMRTFAGGRNVMLATGDGDQPPADRMRWIFSTALSRGELAQIQPNLERGLSDPPRFVFIGRLSPEKGINLLIQAVAAARDNSATPPPNLTLIGDGPQRIELEELVARLQCGGLVRFTGQLDRNALSEELLRQDVCVQPSHTEGFSKAWLDAMAHGLPVLSSNVGAASSVLGSDGERGWLFEAGQLKPLQERITAVTHDFHDWSGIRHRCREFVEQRTLEAWSETIGQWCALQWKATMVEGKLKR